MSNDLYDFTKFDENHFLDEMMRKLYIPTGPTKLTLEEKREKVRYALQALSQETWYEDYVKPYNEQYLKAAD